MKENVRKWPRRIMAMLLCVAMLSALFPVLQVRAEHSDAATGTIASQYVGAEMVSDYGTCGTSCTNHNYTAVTYSTTCLSYAHTCYTCRNCGYSYEVYPDEVMSQWQTVKPNVDQNIIQTGTEYRFCTYNTFTSDRDDLEDYELAGQQWVQAGVSAVNYVGSWPEGFDTTNSLFNMYDNQAQKLSNHSTDLTKLEVNSDQIAGYLYYHWCRSGNSNVSATQSGGNDRFHAYYSTVAPSSANSTNSSNGSYRFDSSTTCSDSKWYFAVPVYAQTYTAYRNQYVYRYWGEFSDWSMTPVEATEECKVETRTVYRYVTANLGAHQYVNNVCSVCGKSKSDTDYYLFGWINGSNYACEENYLSMGTYKFTNGKLTATFNQDSYVGVKSEGNAGWYMTEGWQGEATSVTLYNSNGLSDANKLYVPGGVELEFVLIDNGNDTLTLSYAPKTCTHNYEGKVTVSATCQNNGTMTYTCTGCGHTYTESISAIGHSYRATIVPNTCTSDGYTLYTCGTCGSSYKADYTSAAHNYVNGICTACGSSDSSQMVDYYLVGWINGADHGCDSDYTNKGQYQFVNGKLTATFNQDSYVFVKTGDNSKWLLAETYCQTTTCTFSEGNAERMYVPGNVPLTFTLTENANGSVTVSYTKACDHSYSFVVDTVVTCTSEGVKIYTCKNCGHSYTEVVPPMGHAFVDGTCVRCYTRESDTEIGLIETYYLVGWINGADHGCESDWENLGDYKIEGGKLTVTFSQDSYVFVKSADNNRWMLADQYCEDTTCTFSVGKSEKMFVPGGVELTFTLVENGANSVTLSYVKNTAACTHSYTAKVTTAATCTTAGVKTMTCTKCADSYTESIAALGHNYVSGTCTNCGAADPNYTVPMSDTYYLIGWINGADHGCESDWENLGDYKFVNGKLTATFTQDSYVFIKNGDNSKWLLAENYCEDTTCTFSVGNAEKLFVPGGVKLTFTLKENADGSVTVSYTTGSAAASVKPTLTLKAPALEFKDMITVNAFYTAENTQDVVEMGMITYSTKVSAVDINTAEYVIPGAAYDESTGRYFSASQGIHAKYLCDTVYLACYAKLTDGTYAYTKLASYSAVTYATNQLKNSTNTALKQLVAAMLNYGAAAQSYFGYNTNALANASLTADQKAMPNAYSSGMVGSVPAVPAAKQGSFANNKGFSTRKPAVSFEGAFSINYFFTPAYTPVNGVTLYYWSEADYNAASVLTTANATGAITMKSEGGQYRGDIEGIAAKDLSKAIYVAAVYSDGSTTWTSGVLGYSIDAYCGSLSSSTGTMAELAKATAVYGYHAKAYFG